MAKESKWYNPNSDSVQGNWTLKGDDYPQSHDFFRKLEEEKRERKAKAEALAKEEREKQFKKEMFNSKRNFELEKIQMRLKPLDECLEKLSRISDNMDRVAVKALHILNTIS